MNLSIVCLRKVFHTCGQPQAWVGKYFEASLSLFNTFRHLWPTVVFRLLKSHFCLSFPPGNRTQISRLGNCAGDTPSCSRWDELSSRSSEKGTRHLLWTSRLRPWMVHFLETFCRLRLSGAFFFVSSHFCFSCPPGNRTQISRLGNCAGDTASCSRWDELFSRSSEKGTRHLWT